MSNKILKKLPQEAQALWTETKNSILPTYGDIKASKIAWAIIMNRLHKTGEVWMAKSTDFAKYEKINYEFVADTANISKSENGDTFLEYILTSPTKDSVGDTFGIMAINNIVDQINNEGVVGRVEGGDYHDQWKALNLAGKTPAEIEEILQGQDTGIRAVSAYKDDSGKVHAKIRVNKKLVSEAMKYQGASVEVRVPYDAYRAQNITQARMQGFILTNKPSNPDAIRVE